MGFLAVEFLRVFSTIYVKADITRRLYFLPQLSHFIGRQESCEYFYLFQSLPLSVYHIQWGCTLYFRYQSFVSLFWEIDTMPLRYIFGSRKFVTDLNTLYYLLREQGRLTILALIWSHFSCNKWKNIAQPCSLITSCSLNRYYRVIGNFPWELKNYKVLQ